MKKINGILIIVAFAVLLYTRFVNLSWGLPYPFHPDERNMAVALQGLKCDNLQNLKACMDPQFFAYGQLPLYTGFLFIKSLHFMTGKLGSAIAFEEATLSLRIISAITSVFTVYFGLKIVRLLNKEGKKIKEKKEKQLFNIKNIFIFLVTILIFTFSPGLIQFAHFGTTESVLMLLYLWIIYESIFLIKHQTSNFMQVLRLSLLLGVAVGIKISAAIFFGIPAISIILIHKKNILTSIGQLVTMLLLSIIIAIGSSPHNLINFNNFISSMSYESAVGLGRFIPFYTKQFVDTVPVLFQLFNIFPYVLGWPAYILFFVGFFLLPYTIPYSLLRFSFLIYLLPNAFFFSKWTRFMAPVFPVMIIFSVLAFLTIVSKIKDRISKLQGKNLYLLYKFVFCILFFILILPGMAYLSVYHNPDVRFQASEWIYKNIPEGSYILSEAANVVDIPMPVKNKEIKIRSYNLISFDFYPLDEKPPLAGELSDHINRADYIIVPSRRVFANHTCIENHNSGLKNLGFASKRCGEFEKQYPLLNEYYEKLFSGNYGFKEVAKFVSYPKLEAGSWKLEFPDEDAEETWSVFDHPVVRIYKKI